MKKTITTQQFLKIISDSGLSPNLQQKAKLVKNFEGRYRVDDRIFILRTIVAKGHSPREVARSLKINTYQVNTCLKARRTIPGDQEWTPQTLRESEYKTKFWSKDDFDFIINQEPIPDMFDYSLLANYKNILVKDSK